MDDNISAFLDVRRHAQSLWRIISVDKNVANCSEEIKRSKKAWGELIETDQSILSVPESEVKMSRTLMVAATQMACEWDIDKNVDRAEQLVREAVEKGAQLVFIQERLNIDQN